MTEEEQVRIRAFELWESKGRQPGLLNECLKQARTELDAEVWRDSLAAGTATAPPSSQTRPGQLFQTPDQNRAPIDRRGRTIETDTDQPLLRTQTQGVRQD